MKKVLFPVFLLLTAFFSFAQTDSLMHWQVSAKRITDSVYEIKASATVPSGWHLYAVNPAVDGLQETVIIAYDYENAKNIQPVAFTGVARQINDSVFSKQLNVYSGNINITQQFAITGVIPAELK